MDRPVIGITTKTRFVGGSGSSSTTEIQYSPCEYIQSVYRAGGIPILLPLVACNDSIEAWLERLDGLILSGGRDIDPILYGQEPSKELGGIDGPKDDMEALLVNRILAGKMPTLGICRGIQIVNAIAGGTLFQDVSQATKKPIKHFQSTSDERPTHTVQIEKGSWMESVFGGTSARVNSYHHQCVDEVAPDFKVTARASDGIIEAIEHQKHAFLMCVQFHPEMMNHLPEFLALFQSHVRACQARK